MDDIQTRGISQVFDAITRKVSRVGRSGYGTAILSVASSKRMGKTTVLNMEISGKKREMRKDFQKLGEWVFERIMDKTMVLPDDASVEECVEALKSYDGEVKEIEAYIVSLKENESEMDFSRNRLDKVEDNQNNNTNDIISNTYTKSARFENANVENEKQLNLLGIVNKLQSSHKEDRIESLKELFKFEGHESARYLIDALKDKDSEIRRRAALYIGWKRVVSAAPALVVACEDKNAAVRQSLFEALGELGTKEAVPVLINGLDERDVELRKTAYKALTLVTNEFFAFNEEDTLSRRFKSIQQWEKWWKEQSA